MQEDGEVHDFVRLKRINLENVADFLPRSRTIFESYSLTDVSTALRTCYSESAQVAVLAQRALAHETLVVLCVDYPQRPRGPSWNLTNSHATAQDK